MRLFERKELARVENDVGVGDTAVGQMRRRVRHLAPEAAEQRPAGIVLGEPFWRADPAIAIARAAILEVKGVQHTVADEPVRVGHIELRIGAVAIERAVQLARQFADDFEERRVGLERDRRAICRGLGEGLLLHGYVLPSLHRKDRVATAAASVK
jgi:hypothetical protein